MPPLLGVPAVGAGVVVVGFGVTEVVVGAGVVEVGFGVTLVVVAGEVEVGVLAQAPKASIANTTIAMMMNNPFFTYVPPLLNLFAGLPERRVSANRGSLLFLSNPLPPPLSVFI
jgi:hypothetical protein